MPWTVAGALTFVFLLVMPMVNVLGPSVWFAPPMIVAVSLLTWLVLCRRLVLDDIYIGLVCLIAWCFLQWLVSVPYVSSKTVLHAVGILGATAAFYVGVRGGLVELLRQGRAATIVKCVYAGLLITSTFILTEFVVTNFVGADWNSIVPYIEVEEFHARGAVGMLRARGFASEPGTMALFYDFAMFFVIPLLHRRWYRLGFVFIVLPAFLLLISAASILICGGIFVALGVARMWYRFGSAALKVAVVAAICAIAIIPVADILWEALNGTIGVRLSSLSGGDGDESGRSRLAIYQQILDMLTLRPFGIGFGITPGLAEVGGNYLGVGLEAGQISLFGMFAMAGGPPAVILLLIIIAVAIIRVLRDPMFGRPIAAGGIAISLHLLFVTEYWLPFFWFFLAVASSFASTAEARAKDQRLPMTSAYAWS